MDKWGREYFEALIQKAIPAMLRMRDELEEYNRFNQGRIEAIKMSGQEKLAAEEAKRSLRYIDRRYKAIRRIKRIQEDAWREAFEEEAPVIVAKLPG